VSGIRIRALGEDYSWGARVEGLSWDNIEDQAVRAELQQLFEDRGFIVFEGMEPSGRMQVALSEVFGPLKDHPTKATARADEDLAPGVIDMHVMPREDDGNYHGLVEIDGTKLASFSPWHFDHCYNDELNRAGVLRAVLPAPERGRTGFCDGIELYKSFDPELRRKVETLNILYTLDVRLTQMRFGRFFKTFGDMPWNVSNVEEAKTFPRALHPAVWTRATGEKVLHVGPWMSLGIEGHEDPQGEALFEAVCQEVNRKAHGYWHSWRPDDMLIWDNWRMLHAVEGCDPRYERRMHRTTIKGDYGLGAFEHGKKPGEVYRELPPISLPA
jgi:taurine dioxygenase